MATARETETQDWAATQVERIHQHLLALADPERAAWTRNYLHSERVHLGIAQPEVRATARLFQREFGELSHERMLALLEQAWASEVYDVLAVAVALVERWKLRLVGEDLVWIERWLIEARTWALVIDKTIGWILREVGRKRPALVRGFLAEHLAELAGLSVREAIKSLPAAERASTLARWKSERARAVEW